MHVSMYRQVNTEISFSFTVLYMFAIVLNGPRINADDVTPSFILFLTAAEKN
jgi:hypothetical protein